MKKTLLTALLMLVGLIVYSQTKTVTVVLKDFSEACGEDPGDAAFCLTDEKGAPISERYSCVLSDGIWQVEPKDLITSNATLNPQYKDKTGKLYCSKSAGGAGWIVEKVEFDTQQMVQGGEVSALDKYIGLYVFNNNKSMSFSIGKFPGNTVVKMDAASKYLPLDKKFIGQYFMVNDFFSWETSKVTPFAGGYIAPMVGNLILGVSKNGEITIQNYDNYGKKGDVMELNLGGTSVYGKFVLRADGKYDLLVNNARYVWTKAE